MCGTPQHMEGGPMEVRPQCYVMFETIQRELKEIRVTLGKLLWWIISVLTMLVAGLIVTILTHAAGG